MYSIKQASLRSGVSVPLIRAWERRYGVVTPKRTPSGYRLYDEDAIATLVRVRELTESGWSASEASRALLAGEVPLRSVPSAQLAPLSTAADPQRGSLVARFIAAATVMDGATTGAVLDEMLAQGSFEAVVDDLLMPSLVALGRAWDDGDLDVAAEHAASAAVQRRLAVLFEAAAVPGDHSVVVGLPPGARHDLGALAFSIALRRRGVGVLYLGADVPEASWVHVVSRPSIQLATIAVVQKADRRAALRVARAIREIRPGLLVAAGGRHARWEAALEAGIVVLPDRINEAAAAAARLATGTANARQEGAER
jgi:DNA-binding transcriptional MerR regulator